MRANICHRCKREPHVGFFVVCTGCNRRVCLNCIERTPSGASAFRRCEDCAVTVHAGVSCSCHGGAR
jgi:hypothetical protein